jgi:hypothetical protein
MECVCGCGGNAVGSNKYIKGHNRRGLASCTHGDKWSFKYDECIECHSTKYKHNGNGLCKRCYKKKFYTNYTWKPGESCKICKRTDRPYHANGMCGTCCTNERNRKLGVKKRNIGEWSWYFDKCQMCGTIERAHSARGLCCDCNEVSKRSGDLIECPICKTKVEKLNQHLSMRSRKCEEHKQYQYNLFKMYFESDYSLFDIAKELSMERHGIARAFIKFFGKEETKKRNQIVSRINISDKAKINFNYKNMYGTPTTYNGIRFRSIIESKYAKQLDDKNILWEYEPKHFPYIDVEGKRRTYTPDFYLPEKDKYIEIKSSDLVKDKDLYKVNWVRENARIDIEFVFMK